MKQVLTLLVTFLILAALSGCTTFTAGAPTGEVRIAMSSEPAMPIAGAATTLVFTVTQGGQALADARVLVVRRMIGVVHPDDDSIFESTDEGGGRYTASTAFASAGVWDVQVVVTPAGGEAQTSSFRVNVAQP